jgi:hypothetical protein
VIKISKLSYKARTRLHLLREVVLPSVAVLVCLIPAYSWLLAVLSSVSLLTVEAVLYLFYLLFRKFFGAEQISFTGRRSIARPFGVSVLEFVSYFVFLLVFAWSVGRTFAKHTTWFLVPVGSPNTVVVDIYQDKLLVAPFNRSTRILKPEYRILAPGAAGELRMERVGPLHFETTRPEPPRAVRQSGVKR